MRSFHFLGVVQFDESQNEYVTDQQLSLGDAQPATSLKLITKDFYLDFAKYELFHERKKRDTGRAYGRYDSFDQYINQKTFNAYLWKTQNLFIFEANKESVNGAIKRLKRQYGKSTFNMVRVPVDFQKILRRADNITGSWFGGIKGNVTSVGIYGDHVNLSKDYDRFAASGELSSVTITVNLTKGLYTFMITKDCAIVIYDNMSTEKYLDLVTQIYNELLA